MYRCVDIVRHLGHDVHVLAIHGHLGVELTNRLIRRSFCLLLAVVLPAALVADTNGAILRISGVVTVNGTVTSNVSAVVDGDAIHTADNSNAVITPSGAMITLSSASSIVYRRNAVELASGAVEVTTSNGLEAKADIFTVTPASSGNVRFRVMNQDRGITVMAEQGSLMVFDGTSRKFVKEGSTITSSGDESKGKRKAVCCVLPTVGGLVGGTAVVLIHQNNRKGISCYRLE